MEKNSISNSRIKDAKLLHNIGSSFESAILLIEFSDLYAYNAKRKEEFLRELLLAQFNINKQFAYFFNNAIKNIGVNKTRKILDYIFELVVDEEDLCEKEFNGDIDMSVYDYTYFLHAKEYNDDIGTSVCNSIYDFYEKLLNK